MCDTLHYLHPDQPNLDSRLLTAIQDPSFNRKEYADKHGITVSAVAMQMRDYREYISQENVLKMLCGKLMTPKHVALTSAATCDRCKELFDERQ